MKRLKAKSANVTQFKNEDKVAILKQYSLRDNIMIVYL